MKSYYLAKLLHKIQIPSFNQCVLDPTARVDAGCALTKVEMGKYSYVGAGTQITDTKIGNFCSIGRNCGIGGGVHPMSTVSTSPAFLHGRNFLRKNFANISYASSERVEIGHDVWVGEGVYIKSGVKVGTGAVIGAHAVVTHDIAPYEVVAGVPAKCLRKRFDEEIVHQLLALAWWDWTDDKLDKYGTFFTSPAELLEALEEDKR